MGCFFTPIKNLKLLILQKLKKEEKGEKNEENYNYNLSWIKLGDN